MRVYIYYVGKPRDAHANAMAEEYVKRCGRFARCEMREVKPERTDLWERHAAANKILLDVYGKTMDSPAFSSLVDRAMQQGQDLVFVIAGADGPEPGWREKANLRLSLSPMTFPHEFARVMLTEQVYRAFTMLRGHPYSK